MSLVDLRSSLRDFLLADAALSAAVGAVRIYPLVLPQGMRSASLVYTEISGRGDHTMQGASGIAAPRIQIAAWAATADAAHALALLLKARLDGYRGPTGNSSPVVAVQGAFFENWHDQYDNEAKLYAKISDYFIWYEER